MHMNHFKTMPTPPSTSSHGKMVFHETGPITVCVFLIFSQYEKNKEVDFHFHGLN